jgi:hypothetical protein
MIFGISEESSSNQENVSAVVAMKVSSHHLEQLVFPMVADTF